MPNLYIGTTNPTYNTNLTTTTGLSPTMAGVYNRRMREQMKPKLIHAQLGQKVHMPRNAGTKTVTFRRWTPFPALLGALTEGEVPDGQTLAQSSLTATVAQHGGYVAVSDVLSMTALDPVIQDTVDLMADQGALSIDHLIRNSLHSNVTNVQYTGSNTGIGTIAAADKLTLADVRKAVRTLKKNRAPQFNRGGRSYYVAVVGPDTTYDLQTDTNWVAVAQYQDKEKIFSGEIGRMYGVLFIENNESMVYGASELGSDMKVSSYTSATKTITLTKPLTDDQAADIVAVNKVKYSTVTHSGVASASGTTIVLSGTVDPQDPPTENDVVAVVGPGASGAKVAATLVLGRDAFGVVDMDGEGNVQTIVKPQGSAGAGDPLNQVATIGWKVNAHTTKILEPGWIVQILHGFSA